MKNSIITFVSFVLTILPNAFAQQMPFSSQYYSNQFITNPALTGNKGSTNAFITHRSQWAGISGAPQTTYFSIDGPVKSNNIGIGLTGFSDVTDILHRSGFNASYSYKLKLNATDHCVTFGVALGLINNRIDFSKVVVLDNSDPILTSQQQAKTVINADVGLVYNWRKLEVGLAVPQIVGNKVDYKNNTGLTGTYNLARHYYGSMKYVFDVSQSREIIAYPLLMVRSVAGAPFQYDVNAVLDWKRYGWVGVTYHSNYAVAVSAGVRYKKISVGYAYDIGMSKIRNYTGTTSEFLLSYCFSEEKNEDTKINELIEDLKTLKERDSLQGLLLDSLQKNDSIKSLLLDSIQLKVDSNAMEIENLKNELDVLKKGASALSAAEKKKREEEIAKKEAELKAAKEKEDSLKLAKETTEKGIRTETDDKIGYKTVPGGTSVKAGYYVIIGAFTNADNAQVFTKDAKKKGYSTATIIQNKNNSIYEIVVFSTEKREPAIDKLEGIKADYPDVWVLTLE
jgi:type IX secretion system PorP/SprF family membrane protein